MMRHLASALLSIFLILSSVQTHAEGDAGADASGAGGTPTGVAAPITAGETTPTGLEEVPPRVKQLVLEISKLPGQEAPNGAQIQIPWLGELKKGEALYISNRPTCLADQVRASWFCRSETNPEMQKTVQMINLATAGVNSLAVNDGCKGFSKVMSLAQAGMTAYTVGCAALRKKCTMSCDSAGSGIVLMQSVALTSNTERAEPCVNTNVNNPTACEDAKNKLGVLTKQLIDELGKERNKTLPLSMHNKKQLCVQTYGLLLASAAASMGSIANSMSQGQKCDDESDGSSGGAVTTPSSGSNSSQTTTLPTGNSSTGVDLGSGSASLTAAIQGGAGANGNQNNPVPAPDTSTDGSSGGGRSSASVGGSVAGGGSGNGSGDLSAAASAETAAGRSAASTGSSSEVSSGSSGSGGYGSSGGGGSAYGYSGSGESAANSEYREYLPGGDKDPSRGVAGQEAWRREVTGAGGKSNWAKMQERYRSIKTLNDN